MKSLILMLIALTIIAPAIAHVTPDQIKVPESVAQEIKLMAVEKWPDDVETQKIMIGHQANAYRELYAWAENNKDIAVAKRVFNKAQLEWPGNYEMQWYCVQKRLDLAE